MRNRFSEIFRKRLRKNHEIIAALTYIERKCGLIYIKKFFQIFPHAPTPSYVLT